MTGIMNKPGPAYMGLTGSNLTLVAALQSGTLDDIARALQQGADPYIQHRGKNTVLLLADRIPLDRDADDHAIRAATLFFCKAIAALVIIGEMDLNDPKLLNQGQTVGHQLRYCKKYCPTKMAAVSRT